MPGCIITAPLALDTPMAAFLPGILKRFRGKAWVNNHYAANPKGSTQNLKPSTLGAATVGAAVRLTGIGTSRRADTVAGGSARR